MGTATLEANLLQQLVEISLEPLFQKFLDVIKAYKFMDTRWCMEILRGYGIVPHMACLLTYYWKKKQIVPKEGILLGELFGTEIGVMQGYLASPVIFNIFVGVLVQAVLAEVFGPQEAHHGLGWAAGERNLVFYADNVRIAEWHHTWFQDALKVTVAILGTAGLDTILENTKAMVCTPGFIWVKWSKEAYKSRATVEGETFREKKGIRISCSECGLTVAASSQKHHTARQNRVSAPQTIWFDEGGGEPTTYVVSLPWVLNMVKCPVTGCTAVAHSVGRLRKHFMYRHFCSRVAVVQEGKETMPRCDLCGMHMRLGRLINN